MDSDNYLSGWLYKSPPITSSMFDTHLRYTQYLLKGQSSHLRNPRTSAPPPILCFGILKCKVAPDLPSGSWLGKLVLVKNSEKYLVDSTEWYVSLWILNGDKKSKKGTAWFWLYENLRKSKFSPGYVKFTNPSQPHTFLGYPMGIS